MLGDQLPAPLSRRPGGARGGEIADPSRDAWGPGLAGPHERAPRGSCSGSEPQFPGWCGEMEGLSSHIPFACTRCARNLAAGGSLTLAAALYSGKCRGLPEPPLRSQVASGEARREGPGAAAWRTDARCKTARPGSVQEQGRWEARVTRSGVALAI